MNTDSDATPTKARRPQRHRLHRQPHPRPQLERLANGVAVAKLRVASSATHKRGETYVPHTNYLLVKVFDKRAEACCEYLRKGSRVLINGEIEYFEWTSADRSRRYGLRVIARSVQFLVSPPADPSR